MQTSGEFFPDNVAVDFDMFRLLAENLIICNLNCNLIVIVK